MFGGDQSLLYHKNIEAFFSRQLGGARRSTQSTAIAPPVSFSYSYLLLHSIINISLLSWIENRAPVSETRSFFLLNAAAVNYHHQRYHSFPTLFVFVIIKFFFSCTFVFFRLERACVCIVSYFSKCLSRVFKAALNSIHGAHFSTQWFTGDLF